MTTEIGAASEAWIEQVYHDEYFELDDYYYYALEDISESGHVYLLAQLIAQFGWEL